MALLDISDVTRAIVMLLEQSFNDSVIWAPSPAPTVTPQAPDNFSDNGLCFYLYHLAEDAHFKNLDFTVNGNSEVGCNPMGVTLFYQLTAHTAATDVAGFYARQKMMGIAVKTLHDHAVIDEKTMVHGVHLFPVPLQGGRNRLRISLQPVEASNAVSYWTAGESPLRCAAYYQVSVALLEPAEKPLRPGRVLGYGVNVFGQTPPFIESCENRVTFTIPGEAQPREMTVSPAQVAAGGQLIIRGSGYSPRGARLFLDNSRFSVPVETDAAWFPPVRGAELSVTVQENASGVPVIPGVYAAIVETQRELPQPGGGTKLFIQRSNACPFAVTARIDSVSTPDGMLQCVVRGYLFRHADLPEEKLEVFCGDTQLKRVPGGVLQQSEFTVEDPPPGETLPVVVLRLPTGLVTGRTVAVRLRINGAESPPNFIQVP